MIKPRQKARRFVHVVAIGIAERGERFALLRARELHVHNDENRKHREREQCRPLHEEAEHDQDETDILRMTDVGVWPRRREAMPLTGLNFASLA